MSTHFFEHFFIGKMLERSKENDWFNFIERTLQDGYKIFCCYVVRKLNRFFALGVDMKKSVFIGEANLKHHNLFFSLHGLNKTTGRVAIFEHETLYDAPLSKHDIRAHNLIRLPISAFD